MQTSVPVLKIKQSDRPIVFQKQQFLSLLPQQTTSTIRINLSSGTEYLFVTTLVGGADNNFLAGGAIDTSRLQQQRQQTESAQCLLMQYSCTVGSDVDSGCMRLQRVLRAVHCLSQSTDFLFLFFTAILVPKKETKTKMRMSFSAEK